MIFKDSVFIFNYMCALAWECRAGGGQKRVKTPGPGFTGGVE